MQKEYPQHPSDPYKIQGKLRPANKKDMEGKPYNHLYVNVYRIGRRKKYIDEAGHIYLRMHGFWWRFPQSVEF